MAVRIAASRPRPAWASGSKNLDELGMTAEFGTDADALASHSDMDAGDMETTDTREKK